MAKHRTLSTKNKYYLPKETFLTVVHYCKQYPIWEAEYKALLDQNRATEYDRDRVQTTNDYDATAEPAIKRAMLSKKMEGVTQTAKDVAGDLLWKWLVLGVSYDMPYYALQLKGIPCGKDVYYDRRRKFYFMMSARL